VPARFDNLLPRTLASLQDGGFSSPRLFIDGVKEAQLPEWISSQYKTTCRDTPLRTFGNWTLTAWELYVREPHADFYAIFQDDFVTYKHLREYLEVCHYPARGYWNLYTFPENEKPLNGWCLSNQLGKGAVALVFSGPAIRTVLQSQHMVERPLNKMRGYRAVDGGIVTAFKKAGWSEWVHQPSLVQHTGNESSMGNKKHPEAATFRGEDFDARSLSEIKDTRQARERIGLVGYNSFSGVGEMAYQIATYCDVDLWLVKPQTGVLHRPPHPDVDMMVCPEDNESKLERFLNAVDCVVFVEVPYYSRLLEMAKQKDKRVVCIPMHPWMPAACRGWPQLVDLFVCPTMYSYEQFHQNIPCVEFGPWPIDVHKFAYKERTKANRFLFVNGRGGYQNRKGERIIQEALHHWPDMPLAVSSLVDIALPSSVERVPDVKSNADLYQFGDVLLAPRHLDGVGLEPFEAMASGLPVISTDGKPWNEVPALAKIPAKVDRIKASRPVEWFLPDAEGLVRLCKEILGTDISEASKNARKWCEDNKWGTGRADELNGLIKTGEQRMSIPFAATAEHENANA